jgi:tetratricopeptide (TPR) repeat protein
LETCVEDTVLSFGQMLAEGMRLKGLDYRTLAKLVGVSHGYLWQLVNAEKRAVNDPAAKKKRPREELTRQLAAALDIDALGLLEAAGYKDAAAEPLLAGPTRYTSYTSTARQLYQDGLAASAKGQTDRAVALLEAALERGGVSFVNAHGGLGMAHFNAARYGAAINEFNAALEAYDQDPRGASIELADLVYNRGLAFQRQARQLKGSEQAASRRSAGADFRRAIALEGESQDLYHSAMCYLWLESGHPRRVLPYGRSFLHRQAVGPARFTTASLDINLFLAYAHMALKDSGAGMELVDLSLQLCPNYWFAHYVKAALLAQQSAEPPRRRLASLNAGMVHARRALQYHPAARDHFKGELHGDFKAWAQQPEFLALLEGEAT